jgi:preprotein translocase subunit SecA
MYVFYLDVCLRAKTLFEKDRDYIITNEGVEIVDEFTGRVLPGRRFTDGVHQAIEAKEKVKVKEADKTQASITFQNFFPMYEKLSGMSGTVMRARDEFNQVYKLSVIQVPTNRPLIRVDHNNLFFKTQKGKFLGLIKKIRQIHQRGQPLLIGARNVETAHAVAELLDYENLPYQMLTAADNRAEAEKVQHAGQAGMITVATNMAGRGTDILLGTGVQEAGGLFVLGTERHESRRIDDQLIGRAGRQGDPGESQFLISMEDEIMQLFGSEKIIDVMENLDMAEDEYISGRGLDEAFKRAQDFVESKNFDSRLYLYKYDSVASFQRKAVYQLRDSLLENTPAFLEFLKQAIAAEVGRIFSLGGVGMVKDEFLKIFFIELDESEISNLLLQKSSARVKAKAVSLEAAGQKIADYLLGRAMRIKENPEAFAASQNLILQILDDQWSSQLELMDVLKEEAGLFSYASEDPLIDYILEANKLFANMREEVNKQFAKSIFLYLNQHGM